MGNTKSSPENNQDGDLNVNIVNTQEQHTNLHLDHEQKLWLITVIVIIQLALTIYKLITKRARKRAVKSVSRSMANLAEVITDPK